MFDIRHVYISRGEENSMRRGAFTGGEAERAPAAFIFLVNFPRANPGFMGPVFSTPELQQELSHV